MKAIVALTDREYNMLYDKQASLRRAIDGIKRSELFTYKRFAGYAHYTFKGTYTTKLVEALGGRHPDEDEIIMLVDNGYSHFGASCTINKRDRTFSGRVNTD